MKKRKIAALVLASTFVVGSVAGCKKEDNTETEAVETEVTETTAPTEEVIETTAPAETDAPVETEAPALRPDFEKEGPLLAPYYVDDYESDMLMLRMKRVYSYDSTSISIIIPELMDNYKEKYPELNESLKALEYDLREEYEALDTDPEDYTVVGKSAKVRRAGGDVLSFIFVVTDIDDNITFETKNYDINTGKEIDISSVISDVDALDEYLVGKDASFDSGYQWVMDPEGITFISNGSNGVASEMNVISTFISFDDSLVSSTYGRLDSANGYAMDISVVDGYININGSLQSVDVKSVYGDYEINSFDITFAGCTYTFEDVYGFYANPTLVYNGDIYSLYVTVGQENDARLTYVYELDPVAVISAGEFIGGIDCAYVSGDQVSDRTTDDYSSSSKWHAYYSGVMTDPMHFYVSTRRNDFGTYMTSRLYEATGESAFPVAQDDVNYLINPIIFNVASSFEVTDLDDEDTTYTLEAGEKIILFALIGNKSAIFQTEDDSFVKVNYTQESNYGAEIDGVDVSNLLDGIMFAG